MELDCYQHYFLDALDTEEDFYKSTAPSEDIWKKFELLPTPPMSPARTFSGAALHFPLGDKLSWSSKFLGHEDECLPSSRAELCANLSSIIIRDCMWSSFSASKHLEKVSGKAAVSAVTTTVCPPQLAVRAAKAQCVSAATDCVDPAAVLTIPAANSCRKPASSGSESRSESSDDDEEEIDVVTVKKSKRMQLMNVRKPVTIRVRADPCPKRFHVSVHRQQHNYAARSPDSEPEEEDDEEEEEDDDDEEPQCKRSCAGSDTSLTSDTEDTDRRKNHNFLERKRRNDLRSRFLALRDQIPGLEASKTPKVAILTHATDYLDELHEQERRQLQERKRLKGRQQKLLRKLSDLKRS
ncbi:protein L-Myc-1b-like [Eucyclogobius newberryi]|uniref:protein L-Myc-1b-like n=1 Tax=Eucyclogobius newberryi TaxID=166745 RepID=UPI003B5911FC